MTTHACGRGALEHIILVATFTGDTLVRAIQFERGQVVIEVRGFPCGWGMACTAIRAVCAKMCIIRLMTRKTILRCCGEISQNASVDVAGYTVNVHVAAFQSERIARVAERLAEAVHAIMTGEAVITVIDGMRLGKSRIQLLMTGLAIERIETGDALRMAILTGKRFSRRPLRVTA